MPDSYLVRASRDGDHFHYLWAARRCLPLLSPSAGLVAVTIEGASPEEAKDSTKSVDTKDEVIDIAEYFGSEKLKEAALVRYMQLKHSTLHADEAWPLSGLEKTLKGFAQKYLSVREFLNRSDLAGKLEFWFVTNRPISENVRHVIDDAIAGATPRKPKELEKLEAITDLKGDDLSRFAALIYFDDKQDPSWEQRNLLHQDVRGYLADSDVDAPLQLKELVSRKATSEFKDNPTITKYDILRVLKTDIDALNPAPNLVTKLENPVARDQELTLFSDIIAAGNNPVIIHAEGGVGKSVFATRIEFGMPAGSVTVLYDCFGNGQYRNASRYRHRHKDALVQIANELSAKSLCHPLIPTPHADHSSYIRAFQYRIAQAIAVNRAITPGALLCVVVDAGDNSQIAAEEVGETRSFIRDLLRESIPDGARLIVLCRTHRQTMLDPPLNAIALELQPFSRDETARLLLQSFPEASGNDIDEFHRLSSRNPRVQTLALSRGGSLHEILRLLGPNPTTVEDTIGQILNSSILKLKDALANVEKKQIDGICAGLAALRPLIPISVLAAIADVPQAAIKSFATDLGRPLIVTDNTIQFFDEPAESWFREKFKPQREALNGFVAALRPIASSSAYVAAVLPQLMLEAGQFAELVELALSSDALPSSSPLERRDIELQRLQFALKASLRSKRYLDASKLALRAGGEAAGDSRQRAILQENTDLAALFLEADTIEEIVSRRSFGSGWVGSHHAYEAGLMSGIPDLIGDARSRLRMAMEWLSNWSHLPDEQREHESISDRDIAEIAFAHLNIHGPERCAASLRGWKPKDVTYRVGGLVVERMAEHERFDEINKVAFAAKSDICLILAITNTLSTFGRQAPKAVVARAFDLLTHSRVKLTDSNHWDAQERTIGAIAPFVEAALLQSVCSEKEAQQLLERYLPKEPPRGIASRHGGSRQSYLRAYTLHSTLAGTALSITDLAHPELRKKLDEERGNSHSQEVRELTETLGTLLPWHDLKARALLGRLKKSEIADAVKATKELSSKASPSYRREETDTTDEVARLWIDALALSDALDADHYKEFSEWRGSFRRELYTPTLRHIARALCNVPTLHSEALSIAKRAFEITRDERDSADSKASGYIEIARVVLPVSRAEAHAYFNQAVEVANKIGDENIDRWGAIVDLADRAAKSGRPAAKAAYNFSRCAELSYDHVARDKYFSWDATVRALGGLCPTSSLAILSRWRDRHFGREERILPELIESLVERRELQPLDALVFQGIRAGWDKPSLLSSAISGDTGKATKNDVSRYVYRYMSLERQDSKTWKALKDACSKQGIILPDLENRMASEVSREQVIDARQAENEPWRRRPDVPHDWNSIFNGIDFGSSEDIWKAHQRFRSGSPPFNQEEFFAEAMRRLPAGRRADFIRAFAGVPEYDLYHLRSLLECIPKDWKDNLSVSPALSEAVNEYARRYCLDISKNRYYQVLPFQLASELSGVPEPVLVETILTAIGEKPDVVGSGRLFTLVGLLAVVLTEDDALQGLEYGLSLFDAVLEDKDGDGPWKDEFAPTGSIEHAAAGYIWAGLAAPDATIRWEACHSVLAVCQLQREGLLKQLVLLAKSHNADPFVDQKLPFYDLHAQLWLMIGLARGAKDHPQILAPHFDFLLEVANGPHVLLRKYASRAAIDMIAAGAVADNEGLITTLKNVNCSPLPVLTTDGYSRKYDADKGEIEDDDKYYFGMDMGPYWYAPLGRCFGVSQSRVEADALKIIRKDWGYTGSSRHDEDERARRGYYRDMETYASHGSYPSADDFRFYLAYHAMMLAAGQYLLTHQVGRNSYDDQDEFQEWLDRHSVTRKDGYWLADAREPRPLDRMAWKDEKDNDDWRWSLKKNDFDAVLCPAEGHYALYGYWTNVDDRREEHIHVSSALVSPERAQSLLRALQSTRNPHDFRIPPAGDDLEIDHSEFQLKGWVSSHTRDRELDGFDPWSGSISYPPPRPAKYIAEMLGLSTDTHRRQWQIGDGGPAAMSVSWGQHKEKREEGEVVHGSRLQASTEFVVQLLKKTGMHLIVEVEINRKHGQRRYDSSSREEGFEYPLQSARLFVINAEGRYVSI
jgi:hypothetical protein